ncbi:MAG: hypothetical protein LBK26_03700 [Rickettsiales bacterium]|nr:hypothetical protein [Rickettsiales bacterium]
MTQEDRIFSQENQPRTDVLSQGAQESAMPEVVFAPAKFDGQRNLFQEAYDISKGYDEELIELDNKLIAAQKELENDIIALEKCDDYIVMPEYRQDISADRRKIAKINEEITLLREKRQEIKTWVHLGMNPQHYHR